MQITMKPTGTFEGVNGVQCRIWEGTTDKGVPVQIFVPMIKVSATEHCGDFERELREVKADRRLVYFDHRMVIE